MIYLAEKNRLDPILMRLLELRLLHKKGLLDSSAFSLKEIRTIALIEGEVEREKEKNG